MTGADPRTFDEDRALPPPTEPFPVAQEYAKVVGPSFLRFYRGAFYGWDGTCWREVEECALRKELWAWLDQGWYWKQTKEGSVQEPWNPTRYKLADVLDAYRGVVLLRRDVQAPAWIPDADGLPPADEMVAFENGILHVPTRTLMRHRSAFWQHHALPFRFSKRPAKPRRWLRFLDELWPGDAEMHETLQEMFGYLVSGETRQQKAFLLPGPKRGGKGTIGRVLRGLLGDENVAGVTLAGMAENFGLSPLIDKPLCIISDARLSASANVGMVAERLLSISGEDLLTVDRKYRDQWTGRFPTRFVILTNELPRLLDTSGAMASRFIVLPLSESFFGREDPLLTDELLAELPGILTWALDGLDRLHERGHFRQPSAAVEAVRQLEDLGSPLTAFLRDRCEVGPAFIVPKDDLWHAWRSWCAKEGREHPGTKAVFVRDLRAAQPGIRVTRPRSGEERWHMVQGVRLQPTVEKNPDQA